MTGLFIHGERWERSPKWMIVVFYPRRTLGTFPQMDDWFMIRRERSQNGCVLVGVHRERWESSFKVYFSIFSTF